MTTIVNVGLLFYHFHQNYGFLLGRVIGPQNITLTGSCDYEDARYKESTDASQTISVTCVLLVSDLGHVQSVSAPPCLSMHVCPRAAAQGLVACDVATDSCQCQRGYHMDRGKCVGEWPSVGNKHQCTLRECQGLHEGNITSELWIKLYLLFLTDTCTCICSIGN